MSVGQERRYVRLAVYLCLVSSAASSFLLADRLWAAANVGSLPGWAPLVPPVLFTAFVVIYAVDRALLVRRRNFPIIRALSQTGLAVVFASFLWPTTMGNLRAKRVQDAGQDPAISLLQHKDAKVRAVACEVLGLRGDSSVYSHLQPLASSDKSPSVRVSCERALQTLTTNVAASRE